MNSFADGELDARTREVVAAHLIQCEACHQDLLMVLAIKDSLRQFAEGEPRTLAATRLRRWAARLDGGGKVTAPAGNRARLPVEGGSQTPVDLLVPVARAGRNRRTVRVGTLAGIVATVAIGGGILFRHGSAPDPDPVKTLIQLARLEAAMPLTPNGDSNMEASGTMFELGDQQASVARHLVDGREVFVAISESAFPMPLDARPLGTQRGAPWLVQRGDLVVACVSQPVHMLIVGDLPGDRLVEVASQLHAR